MKTKKVPFWQDPKAPLALDCELAAAVNKEVWRWMHLGAIRMSSKLTALGFETVLHGYRTAAQHLGIAERLAGAGRQKVMDEIFAIPLGLKRSDSSYAQRQRIRKLAAKSRLIYFGTLAEVVFGENAKCVDTKGAEPRYMTSYAVFRVRKTNTCLVYVFYYAKPGL